MKNLKNIYFVALLLGVISLSSCSVENEQLTPYTNTTESTLFPATRSSNSSFLWDYSLSLSSEGTSENDDLGMTIYPVKVQEEQQGYTRSITTNRKSYGSIREPGSGNNRRRPGSGNGGRTRPSTGSTSNILISEPNFIYVGAAFPESEFGKNFSKEIISPRNPIELSTSFPDSYIGEITKETGGLGYKRFLKEVMRSTEYKNFIEKGGRESLDFQCSEFFSYSDIEKAFSANAGLAKVFSARVQSSSKKTNIKSRLIGQLISRNFTVAMELPANGLFKDKEKNTSIENPVFVRSISYGKIALLAIESEYSFEEVKKSVEAGIKWKILSAGASYSSKDIEILQKSTITLYVISDDTNGETDQFFTSLEDIKNAFKLSYSEYNFGLPILCKGYYTKDHSLFTIGTSSPNDGRSSGGSRRSSR